MGWLFSLTNSTIIHDLANQHPIWNVYSIMIHAKYVNKLHVCNVGVQQKWLVVTCNYEARRRGVPKGCGKDEALRHCPDLVLVNGEDLTAYREVSHKVTGETRVILHCQRFFRTSVCFKLLWWNLIVISLFLCHIIIENLALSRSR